MRTCQLLDTEEWRELNDRFFKTLSFGTGGLRGRTIGKVVTAAERGDATDFPIRAHPMRQAM